MSLAVLFISPIKGWGSLSNRTPNSLCEKKIHHIYSVPIQWICSISKTILEMPGICVAGTPSILILNLQSVFPIIAILNSKKQREGQQVYSAFFFLLFQQCTKCKHDFCWMCLGGMYENITCIIKYLKAVSIWQVL